MTAAGTTTAGTTGTDAAALPVATGRRTAAALGALVRPRRGRLAVGLAAAAGASAAGLVAPWVMGGVVDAVVARAGDGSTRVLLAAGAIVVAALVAAVLTGVSTVAVAEVGEGVLARLRERVLGHALALPASTLDRAGRGDLLARVGDDVAVVGRAVQDGVPAVVSSVLTVVLTVAGLAALDWRLGLAGLVAAPGYALALRWYLPRSAPLHAAQRVAVGQRSQTLVATLTGRETVRAYALERGRSAELTARSRTATDLGSTVFALLTRYGARTNGAECLGLAAVLAAGFVVVRSGSGTVGEVTTAALYFHRLFNPVGLLLMTLDEVQKAGASLARLVGVLEVAVAPEPADPPQPADAGLVLRGVGHSWLPGRPVLADVDLALAPGERVALVGATGAGKTTLAGLAAGTHPPSTGTVTLGGVDLAGLGPAALRRHVVLLSQEVHVFAGPLADDVRLADPGADDAAVRAALARVGALGWVDALPDGLATRVGEGGHPLTAAQGQQLALARLVLLDPPVAVLDEATAEAGSAGARDLEDAARAATAGRTTLVVAHRLTQAATADRVVVLEHGRVVEQGSHAELVAAGGRYARLWAAWSGRA